MNDGAVPSLCGEWRLQHVSVVRRSGGDVASHGFPVEGWHRADVPTSSTGHAYRPAVDGWNVACAPRPDQPRALRVRPKGKRDGTALPRRCNDEG